MSLDVRGTYNRLNNRLIVAILTRHQRLGNLRVAGASVNTQDSGKLILRNGVEILIPPAACDKLVPELHSTLLSGEGMRNLAKNKFFLPGMVKALRNKYMECSACKMDSES